MQPRRKADKNSVGLIRFFIVKTIPYRERLTEKHEDEKVQ